MQFWGKFFKIRITYYAKLFYVISFNRIMQLKFEKIHIKQFHEKPIPKQQQKENKQNKTYRCSNQFVKTWKKIKSYFDLKNAVAVLCFVAAFTST